MMNYSRRGLAMPAVLGIIAVIVIAIGIGFYASRAPQEVGETPTGGTAPVKSMGMPAPIILNEQNNSGESGMVLLVEENGKVRVTISLTDAPAGVAQPAHIHTGSCASLGGVDHPLTSVIDGRSDTVLNIPSSHLKEELPLAVNVHKSAAEAGVYVACGDITAELIGAKEMMEKDAMMEKEGMMKEGETMMEKEGGTMMKESGMMGGMKHRVRATAAGFSPQTLEIRKGDTVEFTNQGTAPSWPASAQHPTHTVYPGSNIQKCGSAEAANIFDACRGLKPGETWVFTFQEAGSWGYHDHLNFSLWGKINVQ